MRRISRPVFITFCVIVAIVALLISPLKERTFTSSDSEYYLKYSADNIELVMPQIDAASAKLDYRISSADSYSTWYTFKEAFIFVSDAYLLKASYSPEEFAAISSKIISETEFQSTAPADYEGDHFDETVTIGSFTFQMILDQSQRSLSFPKDICFIGFSDSTNEIAYVYYHDLDIDYISRTMEEFMLDDCGLSILVQ